MCVLRVRVRVGVRVKVRFVLSHACIVLGIVERLTYRVSYRESHRAATMSCMANGASVTWCIVSVITEICVVRIVSLLCSESHLGCPTG